MLTAIPTAHDAVKTALEESFVLDQFDGFWYPAERTERAPALVRVSLAQGSYLIERRRNPASAWTPIVTADVAEFDAASFRGWRQSWSMVADR